MGHWTRRRKERGANLVEFALLAPFLIVLLLGIIDFSWFLFQYQDVRHGTREAARLAATNTDSVAAMTTRVCDAMSTANGAAITFADGGGAIGNTASVTVVANVVSLTGFSQLPFVNALYPSTLNESLQFRLEQQSTNWSPGGPGTCP
jgi:Flp pilus assembly protein TadG